MSTTREHILLEAHAVFHNLVADVSVLRGSAALVRKFHKAMNAIDHLRSSMAPLAFSVSSSSEQVATHAAAIQELAVLFGEVAKTNREMIVDSVPKPFQ
eukprot:7234538-Pyramimonas_sp.AAC.1